MSSTLSSESMPRESKVDSAVTVDGSMSRFSCRMFVMVSMVAMGLPFYGKTSALMVADAGGVRSPAHGKGGARSSGSAVRRRRCADGSS